MRKLIGAVIISVVIGFVGARMHSASEPMVHESVYDRVMRTKTLKCGWFAEPPFINFDANTGVKSGIVIDIINQFSADYGVKVEWETISNFAMMGEDLKQGKYDAVCSSLINMPRGGLIDPVDPFVFVPIYAYVRADESRISSLSQLNNPDIKIAGQEGAAVLAVSKEKFPRAEFFIIPSAELAEMLTSVVAKKADVAFVIPTFYEQFNKNNPGNLKLLDGQHPLQTFAFGFGVKMQEDGIKSLFNNTLYRMMIAGKLEEVFAKHDPAGVLIFPTVEPGGK